MSKKSQNLNYLELTKKVRRKVLEMLASARASHLGSNMSVVEMLVAMHLSIDCEKVRSQSADRSRLIISKGHCAAATYAVSAEFRLLSSDALSNYHVNDSLLAGHVSHKVPFIEHSTGALGHGINVAVGCAIGLRARGFLESKVICLVGDGEIQEGSVWEAIMLASHLKLSNFVLLVDNNQISSIRRTSDVINMEPLSIRFQSFGCNATEVDGHSVGDILDAIAESSKSSGPGVVICNTVKGKGVKFAESDPVWHYRTLNEDLLHEALSELS